MNNSFDPVFGDTVGYGTVIIAQNEIPEPGSAAVMAVAVALLWWRRNPGTP